MHTLPGLLPAVSGYPGWGLWDGNPVPAASQLGSASQFDAAITAAIYYPTGRNRFGFYDNLSDLPTPWTGSVSYTVVGWFSSEANDPLAQSANPEQQIADWNLAYDHHWDWIELGTLIGKAGSIPVNTFLPQLTIAPVATPANPAVRAKAATAKMLTRANQAQTLQNALGTLSAGAAALTPIFSNPAPSSIVCHGSVMDIALTTNPSAFTLTQDQIAVYPTPKRALASIVAPQLSGQQIDNTEMLLQDLDHLKGTTSGLIDLPGAGAGTHFPRCPRQASMLRPIARLRF